MGSFSVFHRAESWQTACCCSRLLHRTGPLCTERRAGPTESSCLGFKPCSTGEGMHSTPKHTRLHPLPPTPLKPLPILLLSFDPSFPFLTLKSTRRNKSVFFFLNCSMRSLLNFTDPRRSETTVNLLRLEKSEADQDDSSLESAKQIAVILNTAPPPPTDNQPTPPPSSPTLLLHSALISQHFESFSHCIFYHFFLRLALSYASARFKIQSQKNKTIRLLDPLSLARSLAVLFSLVSL